MPCNNPSSCISRSYGGLSDPHVAALSRTWLPGGKFQDVHVAKMMTLSTMARPMFGLEILPVHVTVPIRGMASRWRTPSGSGLRSDPTHRLQEPSRFMAHLSSGICPCQDTEKRLASKGSRMVFDE